MRKLISIIVLLFFVTMLSMAQRVTDPLDRGLVAVKTSSGVFCSWRVLADEYYGVKYNLYRNGSTKVNTTPLEVSNYTDTKGGSTSTYTVKAVVNGVEQTACAGVSVWNDKDGNSNPYLPIQAADVVDRNGNTVWKYNNGTVTKTWNYTINDISLGDVDGDGKIDFIVKRKNQQDCDSLFQTANTTAFCRIEVYASTKDYGMLWYIDCGPNTVYGADEQWDAVAFDWDQDGRSEVLFHAYANTIIHKADGTTVTIGSAKENIRPWVAHSANFTFTQTGNEYLVYMDGKTGEPYVTMEYPLKRLEDSEFRQTINWDSPTQSQVDSYLSAVKTAWGDNYGHRSNKFFMGAPYLDGRKPSIFLARGIYTRHKMIAYDVDPTSHMLTEKWTWNNNSSGSAWYAQGYHNYSIADVDGDGCDEIIYGSMVIDNNGKGLSTCGLGHGDAMHVGDLDPFRKGMEVFACNESQPGNNFRNATTSEIYYRHVADGDDGRAMAGNFSNSYPGGMAASVSDGIISLASDKVISELTNNWNATTPSPIAVNMRIYWDGDLLEETLNGPGSYEQPMFVDKNGTRIMLTEGAISNNWTKKNPSAQGDIIGDWREELILRTSDDTGFRVYTTTTPTTYRIPCLWFDPEYRQAMVWQSEGYNQPPHVSYFMGEMEGLTKVPVPLTMTDRTEIVSSGDCIPATANGKDVFAYDKANIGIPVSGVSPRTLVIDVPSTVSGHDDNNYITTSYSTSQLGYGDYKGTLTGTMNLVKQGDGLLNIVANTFDYTGNTDVYAGSVSFSGTLTKSPVWMNRHTTLTTGGTFNRAVTMEYGSTLDIDGNANVDTLNLHEGARVIIDVNDDKLNMKRLSIRKQTWNYGPKYSTPVFEFTAKNTLAVGTYLLGTVNTVDGDVQNVVIEGTCISGKTGKRLKIENGSLYLVVTENSYNILYNQDYETASTIDDSWTTNRTGRYYSRQLERADGTHYGKYNGGETNGAMLTWAGLASIGSDYTSAEHYTLDFDFAVCPVWGGHNSTIQTPSFTVYDTNDNALCHWEAITPAWSDSTDITGDFYLGTDKKSTFNANIEPYFYHVKIKAAPDYGTVMRVTDQDLQSTYYTLSNNVVYIGNWTYYTAKENGGLCLDNIVLTDVLSSLADVPGDVDSDGEVTVKDVKALTNLLLGDKTEGMDTSVADLDGDHEITIADIIAVINLLTVNP